MWRGQYRMVADGREVAVWDPSWWRTGGDFEVDGRAFAVRSNAWGSRFRMLDQAGGEVAHVERAGRKNWSVHAGGRVYEFRRTSLWGNQQELLSAGIKVGSLRRTSAWSGEVEADLPGMPLPVQIFVVGVQIALWQASQAAAGG
ncbi:hypothetical protein Ade02nite_29620 [Paractinoplanes deccanensis]|uniref:Uncharacterized protein n=2 Tax=Paractinoplanes deccanensis TaxID=113561 RepID=A0ABQ3Y2U1_9ACTN|nr:hypothetical protein Ade02nite_29620 [Actinoplanes deccanensis]